MAPSRTLLDTSCVPKPAQASWSAVALHRFLKLQVSASPAVKLWHPASWCYKSARGLAHSRTLPRYSLRAKTRASILECGGPPPLLKLRVSASPAVKLGHPASWCYESARGLAHSRTLRDTRCVPKPTQKNRNSQTLTVRFGAHLRSAIAATFSKTR